MKKVELLAPARDAEVGIEAFNHGADAVYIGSPRFGARAAAGNSVADIERLARYGHQFGARTMVALNTILTDREVPEAQKLAWQLYEAGVDCFIVQDMSLFNLEMPPIELHASTQTDNRTIEKVRLMHQLGASRVVLARELSVEQIRAIHAALPEVELECFVHGALCVCVSGQCYLSAALTGRSANRGECAQPCRLPMDLLSDGRTIVRQKHLLSLRDMNRSAQVAQLIDAGVTSLKIEGRLKEMGYVKNVVAYYRQIIDGILAGDSQLQSVAQGHCQYTFEPNPAKSFNRGFTSYFATDPQPGAEREVMWNHDSPKSQGEPVGSVASVGRDSFEIRSEEPLSNGDGLVVSKTIGFRANRVEGKRVFPLGGAEVCRQLKPGMPVYRNLDVQFDQLLQRPSAKRRIDIDMVFRVVGEGVELTVSDDRNLTVSVRHDGPFEQAQKPQADNYQKQLGKLGETIYQLRSFWQEGGDHLYLPGSVLNQLRRDAVELLTQRRIALVNEQRENHYAEECRTAPKPTSAAAILPSDYHANIHNQLARKLVADLGLKDVEQSFESQPRKACTVMHTRYCLKQALGGCAKYPLQGAEMRAAQAMLGGASLKEPLTLKIGSEKFILKFGCKNSCVSEIIRIFAAE